MKKGFLFILSGVLLTACGNEEATEEKVVKGSEVHTVADQKDKQPITTEKVEVKEEESIELTISSILKVASKYGVVEGDSIERVMVDEGDIFFEVHQDYTTIPEYDNTDGRLAHTVEMYSELSKKLLNDSRFITLTVDYPGVGAVTMEYINHKENEEEKYFDKDVILRKLMFGGY